MRSPAGNVSGSRRDLTRPPHDSPGAESCHPGTARHRSMKGGVAVFVIAAAAAAMVISAH